MKNLACFFLCAFMAFGLSSCNKSNDVDNSEKVIPYRVHESVMTEAGIQTSKSIYFYDSKDRVIRVQIQRMTAGAWVNDSEISYTYSSNKITETKSGAYIKVYTLSKGKVTRYEVTKSSSDELSIYAYNALGDLSSFTEDETPYVVTYDSNNRLSNFSASFSGLGETISMVGTASFYNNKMSSLSVVKTVSNVATLNAKIDYTYSGGFLISESSLSLNEKTNRLDIVPTMTNYIYDTNNCLISYAVSEMGVVALKYDYTYEEGEGNAAIFEYLPSQLLLKKLTGGMIK